MTMDVHAIDGKIPAPDGRFDLVVVGAGAAGTEAAIDAAKTGARVLLIDENPVPGPVIGTDVPQFFGGRATAAVQQQGRMVEQVFATNPRLEEAFEAGVDVRLGTVDWGLYVNGPAMRALPWVGLSNPASTRSVVVLPAPLGPRRPTTSPAPTVNDTSSTARAPPNSRTSPATSMTGAISRQRSMKLRKGRVEPGKRFIVKPIGASPHATPSMAFSLMKKLIS